MGKIQNRWCNVCGHLTFAVFPCLHYTCYACTATAVPTLPRLYLFNISYNLLQKSTRKCFCIKYRLGKEAILPLL